MYGRWRDGRNFDLRRMALRESLGVCAAHPKVRLHPVLARGAASAAHRTGAAEGVEARDRPPGSGEGA